MVDCSKMSLFKNETFCSLKFEDTTCLVDSQPFKATVFFYPQMILYVFNECKHVVSDLHTVSYIYHLMGLSREQWMFDVLKIVQKTPRTLLHMAKMAISGNTCGESHLRRFVIPGETLLHEIVRNGRVLTVKEYKDYFMEINAETRSIFENIWNCGRERETLYMHHMPLFGIYSEALHRTTLTYIMAIEGALRTDIKWEEVHPQTYWCPLEAFNLVYWRAGWPHRECFSMFLDVHLGNLLTMYPWQETQNVLEYSQGGLLGCAEDYFYYWFIRKYMCSSVPLKVLSLKELARFQMALNVFMKKLIVFSDFPLTPMEVEDTGLVENTWEFQHEMGVLKKFLFHLPSDSKGTTVTERGVVCCHVTLDDIQFIWHKANLLPLEVMLNIYKHYEGYSSWGNVIGYDKLVQLEQIFLP